MECQLEYAIVKCTEREFKKLDSKDYIRFMKRKCEYEVLIENKKEFMKKYKSSVIDKITLDDLMFLMIKGEK